MSLLNQTIVKEGYEWKIKFCTMGTPTRTQKNREMTEQPATDCHYGCCSVKLMTWLSAGICCWPSWENCYLMDFLLANSAKQSAYYTFGQKSIIVYRTKDKNLMTCFVIFILVKLNWMKAKESKNLGYIFFHKSKILPSNSFLKAHRGDKA